MRSFIRSVIKGSTRSCIVVTLFLMALPVSSNYQLRSYEFGGGGGSMDSSNFGIEGGIADSAGSGSSSAFGLNSGLNFEQNANVPTVTLSNSGSWYNKLLVVIGQENNPSDAKYALSISVDNFATTQYVQSDNTVGSSLGIEDYQTYTAWGSGSGEYIIGLIANTTYSVKAKALHGEFSESAYGPASVASTSNVSLTFDLDVGGSGDPGETAHPYAVALGNLTSGVIATATNRVWIDISTNAEAGGYVYIYDQYGGIRSTNYNYTISSASNDLSGVGEGFGLQGETVGQGSGGPLAMVSPYNGSGENVGIVNTTIRELFSTSSSPITNGRGSFLFKTKASNAAPASGDYTDTVTLIASSTF